MGASSNGPPLLEVEDLHVSYNTVEAVHGASFRVARGEIMALIGANGAGKTSILTAIVGGRAQASGRIVLDGSEIGHLSTPERIRRGVALVPEGRRLFLGMTVEENLYIGGQVLPSKAHKGNLAAVYDRLPRLRSLRRSLAGNLSGGEQQLCALGRALMSMPRLLLFDELSLGLSPIAADQVAALLVDLRKEGTSVVLVDQEVERVLDIADNASVLRSGRLQMTDTARALRESDNIKAEFFGI